MMQNPDEQSAEILAERIIQLYTREQLKIATAESCTGGLLAAYLTGVSGSSATFERGFISYSNQSKTDLLDVPPQLIEKFGAVSPEVATQMALGILENSKADCALSITGIAGPTGGSLEKPVGLVFFGFSQKQGRTFSEKKLFPPNLSREGIRLHSAHYALQIFEREISNL